MQLILICVERENKQCEAARCVIKRAVCILARAVPPGQTD